MTHDWIREHDAVLVTQYRLRGARWCAEFIGCKISDVRQRVRKLKLAKQRSKITTAEFENWVKLLHSKGLGDHEICVVISENAGESFSEGRVWGTRKRLGLPANRKSGGQPRAR